MSHTTDQELLALFQEQNLEAAFEELFNRYRDDLHQFLCRILYGNHDLADEVLQLTFIKLFEGRIHYCQSQSIQSWLFVIARNQAKDLLRATKCRRRILSLEATTTLEGAGRFGFDPADESQPEPAQIAIDAELHASLHEALASLPPLLQVAVRMVYFNGLTFAEAAKRLNVPLPTLKDRVRRSYELMRKFLAIQVDDDEPDAGPQILSMYLPSEPLAKAL